MSRSILIIALGLLVPAGIQAVGKAPHRGTAAPVSRLTGAAPSIEMLIARFSKALANKDREALARLRVSEAEYRQIILPGNVEPGAPPRKLSKKESDFAWAMLDTKSRYSEVALMDQFGGRTYTVTVFDFAKGKKRWAGFTAHQKLHLELEDRDGRQGELTTGSIAELNGRFKFVSFIRD